MAKLNKASTALLATIAASMVEGQPGYTFVNAADAKQLVDGGLAEQNAGTVDPSDAAKVATRLTDAGSAEAAKSAAPVAGKASYQIVTDAPAPSPLRRKTETYPFASLEVNQAFFIPKTDKRPDPVKAIASTITSANKRFSEESDKRKFVVRPAPEGYSLGEGALVYRVEPGFGKSAE